MKIDSWYSGTKPDRSAGSKTIHAGGAVIIAQYKLRDITLQVNLYGTSPDGSDDSQDNWHMRARR